MLAEIRLLRPTSQEFEVVLVGYPGHLDLAAARRTAGDRPVVFNPLVSLFDTFVEDRRRFGRRSAAGRALAAIDRHALRSADLVVADTAANAEYLRRLAGLSADRIAVCFVGAEDRLFTPGWAPIPARPFTALFVGKLIPLHGVETVLAAARLVPDLHFRIIGSGQLEPLLRSPPPNVAHVAWVDYPLLAGELHRAGCALGIFGASDKAQRVIPNKVFQALACGTPVVTGDTPAARELLVDGESALLVPAGEPEALAEAVGRLAADAELARKIADGGRRAYEEQASEGVLGARWRDLLAQVAG